MPYPSHAHCVAKVNATHIALTGGYPLSSNLNKFYLYNIETGKWTRMPNNINQRVYHACGLIQSKEGGVELVTAGGYEDGHERTSSIFNFNRNEWTQGPDLPVWLYATGNSVVPHKNSFLIVGGGSAKENSKSIYEFQVETRTWKKMPIMLKAGRYHAAALKVPKSLVKC